MLEGMEIIFDDMKNMMKHLKKKSYEKNMEQFLRQQGHYFKEMTDYIEAAEDKEKAAHELGASFATAVKGKYATGVRNKVPSYVQSDLNFFMIYYVFPAILKTEHENRKLIADSVCEEWNACFGCGIGYTDYDTLYASFREKIFGIF